MLAAAPASLHRFELGCNAKVPPTALKLGMLMQNAFKIVYVAPMKALAAEVTAAFSHRLAPLGAAPSTLLSSFWCHIALH